MIMTPETFHIAGLIWRELQYNLVLYDTRRVDLSGSLVRGVLDRSAKYCMSYFDPLRLSVSVRPVSMALGLYRKQTV